jgi:hypothetical protein
VGVGATACDRVADHGIDDDHDCAAHHHDHRAAHHDHGAAHHDHVPPGEAAGTAGPPDNDDNDGNDDNDDGRLWLVP